MDLKTLQEKIQEKLNEIGYELISLTTKREKADLVLSIVVDRVEKISMEDIVNVSRLLNDYLDLIDPFETSYVLDISSLGAEKPLKIEQLSNYLNAYVHVHLINPIKGENIYEGTLKEVNESSIKVEFKNKTRVLNVDIDKANVSNIRLAIKF